MRAVLYARFSTEKQSEASIRDQFRECERVAQANALQVVERFSDARISGGTASRPGYQAMLAAARARKFEIVITEDISRLWRNRAEFGPRSAELEDLGINWISCVGQDTRRDGWGLVVQILQAMAEQQRRETAYRTRRGLEGRARAGKSAGGRSYGYIPAGLSASGAVEIDATQAAIVRRIFRMYSDGVSPRAIAARLNAERVPSPGSGWKRTQRRKTAWLASAIQGDTKRGTGILGNVLYNGVLIWNRTRWVRSAADSAKRRCVLNPRKEWIEHPAEHLRIVPEQLWQRARARQARSGVGRGALVRGGLRKRAGGAGRPGKYLFTGLLACDLCGAGFVLRNREYYCCASHWNGGACSNTINVSRALVQDVLLEGIRDDLADPEVIGEVERRLRAAVRQQGQPTADHAKRIAALKVEISNLTDAIAGGLLKSSPALAQRLQTGEVERSKRAAISRRGASKFVGANGRWYSSIRSSSRQRPRRLREPIASRRLPSGPRSHCRQARRAAWLPAGGAREAWSR